MKNKIFKVLLIGKPESIKSEILQKYSYDQNSPGTKLTIGVDFAVNYLNTPDMGYVTLQLWDVQMQETWLTTIPSLCEGVSGVLLFFSQEKIANLNMFNIWISRIQKNSKNSPMLLVNVDSKEHPALIAPNEEVQKFMQQHDIDDYLVVNINSEESINNMFLILTKLMVENLQTT